MTASPDSTQFLTARWLVPVSGDPVQFGAVELSGAQIAAVHRRLPEGLSPERITDYGEALIMPGLINLHTHIEYTDMRLFDTDSELFKWIPGLMQGVKNWGAQDFRRSAINGAAAIAGSGTTCVLDSSYTGQAACALAEIGLRGVVGLELFGVNDEHSEASWQRWCDRRQALLDSFAAGGSDDPVLAKTAQAVNEGLIKISVAPHAPYTVCSPLLKRASAWARSQALPLTIHLAESQHECRWVEQGDALVDGFLLALHGVVPEGDLSRLSSRAAGCSPTELLERCGVLDRLLVAAHAGHLQAHDIELLRRAGVTVAHCPRSNARLRNGIAPVPALVAAGVNVGFGTDSLASNEDLDLLAEARFAWNLHRAHDPGFAADAAEAVKSLTVQAARALGMEHLIGSLEAGKMADIACFNLPERAVAEAADPYDLIMHGELQLRDLYVAGRHVLNNAL